MESIDTVKQEKPPERKRPFVKQMSDESRRRGGDRGRLARWGLRGLPPIEEEEP